MVVVYRLSLSGVVSSAQNDDHAAVLLASSESVQSAFVAKFDLVQHCADGHRPYNVKFP